MQSDILEDLDLQEYEDSVVSNMNKRVGYPCVVLSNIADLNDPDGSTIVNYLAEHDRGSIPLCVLDDDSVIPIGYTDLKLDSILDIRVLSKSIDVKLWIDENTSKDLTLTDPNTFTKLLGFVG